MRAGASEHSVPYIIHEPPSILLSTLLECKLNGGDTHRILKPYLLSLNSFELFVLSGRDAKTFAHTHLCLLMTADTLTHV